MVAVLNLLAAVNSTWFLLGVLGSPVVMVAAAVLMFRYGTLGLFFFGWDGPNLFAQAGHILMIVAVVYVAAVCF